MAYLAHGAGIASTCQALSSPDALPDTLLAAFPERRARVAEALADLAAIMTPGLAALRALSQSTHDTSAPAQALWGEFLAARQAVIALAEAGTADHQ